MVKYSRNPLLFCPTIYKGGFAMNSINRVAFTLFGQPIYWYGILIALGLLLAALLAMSRERRLGLKEDTTLGMLFLAVPLALVFARIYYVIFSWDLYKDNPMDIFNFRKGGIAIYGAIIGGALGGWLYCKIKKVSFAAIADLAAPSLALGQAIGRWGNFVNQEAYGRLVENPALHFFPIAVYIEHTGSYHYATFFYESIWCFIICAALLIAERKNVFRKRGDMFIWYAMLYAAERMLVEGLRTDSLYWANIRVSQMLSLIIMLLGVFVIARRAQKGYTLSNAMRGGLIGALILSAATLAVLTGRFALNTGLRIGLEAGCTLILLASAGLLYRHTPNVLKDR